MKKAVIFLVLFFGTLVTAQTKQEYLKNNRYDLLSQNYSFPNADNSAKIIGFGGYHGSAKTYDAEFCLIKDFKEKKLLDYYIPEVNNSQAYFFNQYLETGDTALLYELTLSFQAIVSQEGTIDTYKHWIKLKNLNDKLPFHEKIKVLGCDKYFEYYFAIKHILSLTKEIDNWPVKDELESLLVNETLSLSIGDSITEHKLQRLANEYAEKFEVYSSQISDTADFNYILKNLRYNFDRKVGREKIIYNNFSLLSKRLQLKTQHLFIKYGFFHLEKEQEDNFPSFFTQLIEQKDYASKEIVTIMAYFTNSQVLWNKEYDENGNYKGYKIEKGFGISDYWLEYFKGIKHLKKTKLSDLTMFRISGDDSPYNEGVDLIEIKMLFSKSNKVGLKGKNTSQFIDYAILISDSMEQIPIEEKVKPKF